MNLTRRTSLGAMVGLAVNLLVASTASAQDKPIVIGPADLLADYSANEVAADQKYKSKAVEITGTVDKIGKDALNTMYLALAAGDRIRCVQAFFGNEHAAMLAKLAKGDEVTVRGTCQGLMGNVLVKDCALVQSAEVFLKRGLAKLDAQDADGAIVALTEAIRLDPKLVRAHVELGNARFYRNDLAGAIQSYDTALGLDPKNITARGNRGIAKKNKGDAKGALEDFDAVVKAEPSTNAFYNRGTAKVDLADLKGAADDFGEAIKLDQFAKDPRPLIYRGEIRVKLGDFKGATEDCTMAIHRDPENSAGFFWRGKAREALGDKRGAGLDLDVALGLKPDAEDAEKTRALARAYVWPDSPAQAPAAETPEEAARRGKIEGSLGQWVGPQVAGIGVHVWGPRVHVTLRGRFLKDDKPINENPAPGVHDMKIEDSLVKDAKGCIQEDPETKAATITVIDLTGTVAKIADGMGGDSKRPAQAPKAPGTEPAAPVGGAVVVSPEERELLVAVVAALRKRDPEQAKTAASTLRAKSKNAPVPDRADQAVKLAADVEQLYGARCPDPHLAKTYRTVPLEEIQWVALGATDKGEWVGLAATMMAAVEGKAVPGPLHATNEAARSLLGTLGLPDPEVVADLKGAAALREAEREPFFTRKDKLAGVSKTAPGTVFDAAAKLESEIIGVLADGRKDFLVALSKRDVPAAEQAQAGLAKTGETRLADRAAWLKVDATRALEPVSRALELMKLLKASFDKAVGRTKVDYKTTRLNDIFDTVAASSMTGPDVQFAATVAAAAEKKPNARWATNKLSGQKEKVQALLDALGLEYPGK